ncbi:SAM-dependent methyltransferase [Paenibacillus sp. A14]|uniref:SAM-dependent methyltransferase n=1 Tax=Paenibacillus sp. A14 TaxID=3119820 RepID=UPI002FE1F882
MNNEIERETGTDSGAEFITRWVCSANHGFAPYAQEELRRQFGAVKSTMLVPGEVFLVSLKAGQQQVAASLRQKEPIFLRHLFAVQWEWVSGEEEPSGNSECGLEELARFLRADARLHGAKIAIQTRKSEQAVWEGSAAELKEALQARLDGIDAEIVVREADWIVSVFAAKERILAGITAPADNLSDWNGGAIRFQREEGQISRAKFKLLEAEAIFGIDFSSFQEAVDIGAAPGGWTSFLLERGMKVTAVDPAKLHPDVLRNPRLTHLRKNANSVKFREHQFDLLVCDMSWNPKLTAKLVTELLYALVPGGTAIVTVKLLSKKPMALIQEITATFEASRLQIQRAKQLFHNRDEITLYMIKY